MSKSWSAALRHTRGIRTSRHYSRGLLAFDGQLERARGIVESCAPGNYAIVPTSSNYSMFTLAVLADVVGELNDPVLAAPLLDRLLPYAHLTALAPPEASAGSLARPIAVLHGVLGQLDEAERSFDTARQNASRDGCAGRGKRTRITNTPTCCERMVCTTRSA